MTDKTTKDTPPQTENNNNNKINNNSDKDNNFITVKQIHNDADIIIKSISSISNQLSTTNRLIATIPLTLKEGFLNLIKMSGFINQQDARRFTRQNTNLQKSQINYYNTIDVHANDNQILKESLDNPKGFEDYKANNEALKNLTQEIHKFKLTDVTDAGSDLFDKLDNFIPGASKIGAIISTPNKIIKNITSLVESFANLTEITKYKQEQNPYYSYFDKNTILSSIYDKLESNNKISRIDTSKSTKNEINTNTSIIQKEITKTVESTILENLYGVKTTKELSGTDKENFDSIFKAYTKEINNFIDNKENSIKKYSDTQSYINDIWKQLTNNQKIYDETIKVVNSLDNNAVLTEAILSNSHTSLLQSDKIKNISAEHTTDNTNNTIQTEILNIIKQNLLDQIYRVKTESHLSNENRSDFNSLVSTYSSEIKSIIDNKQDESTSKNATEYINDIWTELYKNKNISTRTEQSIAAVTANNSNLNNYTKLSNDTIEFNDNNTIIKLLQKLNSTASNILNTLTRDKKYSSQKRSPSSAINLKNRSVIPTNKIGGIPSDIAGDIAGDASSKIIQSKLDDDTTKPTDIIIPEVPDDITNTSKFSKIISAFKSVFSKEGMKNIATNFKSVLSKLLGTFKAIVTAAAASIIMLFVGATVLFFIKAIKYFKQFEDNFKHFAINTGLVRNQFANIMSDLIDINVELVQAGASQEDYLDVVTKLKQEYGTLIGYSKNLALTITKYKTDLGVDPTNLIKTVKNLDTLNVSSERSKLTFIDRVKQTALASGVAINDAFAKLADSSGEFYSYISKSPEKLIEMSVYATKLNISFDKLSSIADGILDIESSIESTMEANVLSGKNMNLELARYKALQGDMSGMYNELLKQVGSLSSFNNMNIFAQRSVAKALGMSTSELREQLMLQQKINDNPDAFKRHTEFSNSIRTVWDKIKSYASSALISALTPALKWFQTIIEKIEPYFDTTTQKGKQFMNMLESTVKKIGLNFKYLFEKILNIGKETDLNDIMFNKVPEFLIKVSDTALIIASVISTIPQAIAWISDKFKSLELIAKLLGYAATGNFAGLIGTGSKFIVADKISGKKNESITKYHNTNNVTQISASYASGTDYHTGGLALVGELGPEIVNLPTGSSVKTNEELNSIIKNVNTNTDNNKNKSSNVNTSQIDTSKIENLLVNLIQAVKQQKNPNISIDGTILNKELASIGAYASIG